MWLHISFVPFKLVFLPGAALIVFSRVSHALALLSMQVHLSDVHSLYAFRALVSAGGTQSRTFLVSAFVVSSMYSYMYIRVRTDDCNARAHVDRSRWSTRNVSDTSGEREDRPDGIQNWKARPRYIKMRTLPAPIHPPRRLVRLLSVLQKTIAIPARILVSLASRSEVDYRAVRSDREGPSPPRTFWHVSTLSRWFRVSDTVAFYVLLLRKEDDSESWKT